MHTDDSGGDRKGPAADAARESELTPRRIVEELDRYIIAQEDAKKAVAVALRNRWRRLQVQGPLRDEIIPKNIIMIGPTGVGKTEISRRRAKLVNAPFVKVEASKFTEVGYVGRDVDSIVRELADAAYALVTAEAKERVRAHAEQLAEERLLDALLPGSAQTAEKAPSGPVILQDEAGVGHVESGEPAGGTREKLRRLLRQGALDDRVVEIETVRQMSTQMQVLGPQGMSEVEGQLKEMFAGMLPKQRERRKAAVREAWKLLVQEAQESRLNHEELAEAAVRRAGESGIVFIDEIDKICGSVAGRGPDVSREGVQRDLLPIVEGSAVNTRYGVVQTDHVLFIASGAFHAVKPSDLMPEFQGRFPIRVELRSLNAEHFVRILSEPENALTKQYQALLAAEGVELEFEGEAIEEIAGVTEEVNGSMENIGARRLYTVLEKVLEGLLFTAEASTGQKVVIDRAYVQRELAGIVKDSDLTRFML